MAAVGVHALSTDIRFPGNQVDVIIALFIRWGSTPFFGYGVRVLQIIEELRLKYVTVGGRQNCRVLRRFLPLVCAHLVLVTHANPSLGVALRGS